MFKFVLAQFVDSSSTEDTCNKLAAALEKAQHWAITHASRFAPEKFQLTHFTRARKNVELQQRIETSWCEISPSPTCKYLGVPMDSKLQWRAHVEDIRRRVTKTIGGLASLGNSAWGIGLQGMRRIYEGVAVPQMMYACSAWSHARSTGVPYTQNTLHTLENLQARAARAISSAFKATSYAALNVEAHLMPVSQRIEQRNKEALIEMLSAGRTTQDRTRGNRQTRHFYPLQSYAVSAERQGLVDHGFRLEVIPAFVMPPWQRGPVTHIEPAAEARSTHDRLFRSDHSMCIYIDGSRINGHIGAAAVLPVRQKTMKAYVGPESASTVCAAELQGIKPRASDCGCGGEGDQANVRDRDIHRQPSSNPLSVSR